MESPKVMVLKGIHDSDALRHFVGYTYCSWCGKEGQNKGTMVNHLRTTHYRLGLVCNLCFGCPTVTLDTLLTHLGESPGTLHGISPRYLSAIYS